MKGPDVHDFFYREKHDRKKLQSNLRSFQSNLASRPRPLTPLRSRIVPQASPSHNECRTDAHTDERQCHHGDSNRVPMKPVPVRSGLTHRDKSRRSNQQPECTESDKEGANTLQDSKEETRPGNYADRNQCPHGPQD
jgi:hypothetical protein